MRTKTDEHWMGQALRVARRGAGNTAENPAVGCVIIDHQGNLVATGHTASAGRPHAETQALVMAGKAASGGTVYVTLEPCAHQGKTPPCAKALIAAGIKRVVIAASDPDLRVNGKGIDMLRRAGITLETGLLEKPAQFQMRGFFKRTTTGRPHVILKLAVSADGKIAAGPGQRTQITGSQFKARVHLLRAQVDAILVGAGTVRADEPSLTCRLPGLENRSPVRVIVGGDENLPIPQPAIHFKGLVDLPESLQELGQQGINLLMVEGGAKIARSFLEADLIDEVLLATAPMEIGEQGINALAGMPPSHIDAHIEAQGRFVLESRQTLGRDVVKHYLRIKRTG